ncbi:hypothetical protein DNC80_09400 [Flavobacterium sp. SOK18b]|nr:hypothetical protein [Flavobacterium sp. SOK18b]
MVNSPIFAPKKTTVIFNTNTSNILDSTGKYYNRICDYFYEKDLKNTFFIEEPTGFKHFKSRRHSNYYSKLSFSIFIEIYGKILKIIEKSKTKQSAQIVDEIILEINEILSSKNLSIDSDKLKSALIRRIILIKPTYCLYMFFFKLKRVKNIYIEDGYYGLDKSIIIKAAKDLKIKVFEPQHGFVNKLHPAYNFGTEILKNASLKSYYPDYFLCYGEFWKNNINVFNETILFGNPHLEKTIKEKTNFKVKKQILVIGSGVTIIETNLLLKSLLKYKFEGYEIVYRPHPLESENINSRYSENIKLGIKIDKKDLYDSLIESEIIVGELSTVIFEALAFRKTVYLFNSSYTKTYIDKNIKFFKLFSLDNIESIFDKQTFDNDSIEYYWKQNWEQSYKKIELNK